MYPLLFDNMQGVHRQDNQHFLLYSFLQFFIISLAYELARIIRDGEAKNYVGQREATKLEEEVYKLGQDSLY